MTVTSPCEIISDGEINTILSKHLKKQGTYYLSNVYTTKQCPPVIYKPKSQRALLVTKTTHFALLQSPNKIPLLALEVFTYCTFTSDNVEKIVYVSKADSTGLEGSGDVNIGGFVTDYLDWVCKFPIKLLLANMKLKKLEKETNDRNEDESRIEKIDKSFVSETHHALYVLQQRASGKLHFHISPNNNTCTALEYLQRLGIDLLSIKNENIITKLVLFTRSEGQYLFPNSMKNTEKHILDGRQLLKWWLKNIDKIVRNWKRCEKYLDILNSEKREIIRYFPSEDWNVGNVYSKDVDRNVLPAIYTIPLLPDDPKGRFLEHLVVEGRAKKVKCKQYWQELAIRQEFSFGAIVGLIGVWGHIPNYDTKENETNFVFPNILKRIKELITSKDYSDKSDWGLLYDELLSIKGLKQYKIVGTWEGRTTAHSKRKSETTTPTVNTLMCVRSKKKKT